MPDIAIWNQCNSHCIMCTNSSEYQTRKNSTYYSLKKLKEVWGQRPIKPHESLSFTGGETTIHPQFFKVVHWFHKKFPKSPVVIASNGRMFYYKEFTKNLLKINNIHIEVALHGHDAKSHDAITRSKGSFKQTIAGIHNLIKYKKPSQGLELRLIITKLTYKNLDKILAFIKSEFNIKKIQSVVLIFIEMEGQAQDNLNVVGVSYKEVMKYLPKVVDTWLPVFKDLRLYHFPLCIIPPKYWPYTWRTLRAEEIIYLPACKKCPYKKYCLGIHDHYSKLMGGKEFKPPKNVKVKTRDYFYNPIVSASRE